MGANHSEQEAGHITALRRDVPHFLIFKAKDSLFDAIHQAEQLLPLPVWELNPDIRLLKADNGAQPQALMEDCLLCFCAAFQFLYIYFFLGRTLLLLLSSGVFLLLLIGIHPR